MAVIPVSVEFNLAGSFQQNQDDGVPLLYSRNGNLSTSLNTPNLRHPMRSRLQFAMFDTRRDRPVGGLSQAPYVFSFMARSLEWSPSRCSSKARHRKPGTGTDRRRLAGL